MCHDSAVLCWREKMSDSFQTHTHTNFYFIILAPVEKTRERFLCFFYSSNFVGLILGLLYQFFLLSFCMDVPKGGSNILKVEFFSHSTLQLG